MGFEKFEPIQPYGSNRLSAKFQEEESKRQRDVSEQKGDVNYVKLVNNSKSQPFKAGVLPEAGSLPSECLAIYLESGKGEFISRFQIIGLLSSDTFKKMCREGRLSLFNRTGRIIFTRRESWISGQGRYVYEMGEVARLEKETEEDLVKTGICLQLNVVRDYE